MKRRQFLGSAAALAGTLALARTHATAASQPGELTKVRSRHLDELLRRPNTDFGTYRKVRLDAIRAETDPGWVKSMNFDRRSGPKMGPEDAKKLADQAAESLARALVAAFSARGFELVKEPGPGVMNVSASATGIFLNAPESTEAGKRSVTEEVGKATLQFEGRDAVAGTVLIKTTHKGVAKTVDRAALATNVSNRFYFDALFSQWAGNVVQELK